LKKWDFSVFQELISLFVLPFFTKLGEVVQFDKGYRMGIAELFLKIFPGLWQMGYSGLVSRFSKKFYSRKMLKHVNWQSLQASCSQNFSSNGSLLQKLWHLFWQQTFVRQYMYCINNESIVHVGIQSPFKREMRSVCRNIEAKKWWIFVIEWFYIPKIIEKCQFLT
jgi:hypothetical protein